MNLSNKKDDVEGDELHPNEELEGEAQGRAGEPEEEEVKAIRSPIIPNTPSQEEVREHRITHRPFRSWCPHCVRGKGRASPHLPSSQKDTASDVPKLVSDYFFIGRRRPSERGQRDAEEAAAEGEGQTPIIVLKDTVSKSIFAHACPCKGAHEAVISRLIQDLNSLGYRKVLIRTDGEPVILD